MIKLCTLMFNEALIQTIMAMVEAIRTRICDEQERENSSRAPERQPLFTVNLKSQRNGGLYLEAYAEDIIEALQNLVNQSMNICSEFETLMCAQPLETYVKDGGFDIKY
eukprot:TRINITY_DN13039_c0_g1_i1.p1 TRINITY_DN13039_c0_g1~~TRINITY_DN13039_c0_g1_i1.p1  ORF type:complete len:109 (-),score=19.59 TRINITY_DN13039_c0_g1_i1:219-545(-)